MYSNNNYAFIFFIILCFALLISTDGSDLSTNYYDKSCRGLQDIVMAGVVNATSFNERVPASLLRLHFHDCFVLGCDASVLLDAKKGEQFAGPNKNSILGLDVIDNIKADVENKCPKTVTCADILALAAGAAVQKSLKNVNDMYQAWKVPLGRLDGLIYNQTATNLQIPSPDDPIQVLKKTFAVKGLTVQDMVALSGGHTLGKAKCSTIKKRIYFPNSTNTVNASLLQHLKKPCRNDISTDSKTVPLDKQTPLIFDNKYYANIKNKEAVLESDQTLDSDPETLKWVNKYKDHFPDFVMDFANAMVKLGNVGVLKGTKNGEIRKKCGSTNSKKDVAAAPTALIINNYNN